MSTYYGFRCESCHLLGGFMSRQAWGVGNADLIDNFKFVMYHTLNCGTDAIGVYSEHDAVYGEYEDTNLNNEARKKHLNDTEDIMPSSGDWGFVSERQDIEWPEVKKQWVENELKAFYDESN